MGQSVASIAKLNDCCVDKYLTEHKGFSMWLSAGHCVHIDFLQHSPLPKLSAFCTNRLNTCIVVSTYNKISLLVEISMQRVQMKTTFIYNIIICWGEKKKSLSFVITKSCQSQSRAIYIAIGLIITFPNNNDYSFSGDNDRVIISIPKLCSR